MGGTDELRERVRGEVIGPDDAGYEDARKVFNAMIDRRPSLIVRPAGSDDVVTAGSPLGQALIGQIAGDTITYAGPDGELQAQVVALRAP